MEDLFREFRSKENPHKKPMTAKEGHELMKIHKYTTKLYKQIESGLWSVNNDLRHFLLDGIKEKRPDIFEKLSEDVKLKDRTRNKVLNEEGNKYIR